MAIYTDRSAIVETAVWRHAKTQGLLIVCQVLKPNVLHISAQSALTSVTTNRASRSGRSLAFSSAALLLGHGAPFMFVEGLRPCAAAATACVTNRINAKNVHQPWQPHLQHCRLLKTARRCLFPVAAFVTVIPIIESTLPAPFCLVHCTPSA